MKRMSHARRNQLLRLAEQKKKKKEERQMQCDSTAVSNGKHTSGCHGDDDAAQSSTSEISQVLANTLRGTDPSFSLFSEPSSSQSTETTFAAKIRHSDKFLPGVFDGVKPEFVLVDKNMMKRVARCSRCAFRNSSRVTSCRGSAMNIANVCCDCNCEFSDWTSCKTKPERGRFDVNARLVEFSLHHGGFAALEDFAMYLEMDIVSKSTYYEIAAEVEENGVRRVNDALRKTVEFLHSSLEGDGSGAEGIKDISVSCDGSWPKRGFTSNYGFVSVIHVDTGLALDYEILCKYCKYCEMHKDDEGDWYENHKDMCDINFSGSSPAMETEGWKRLWSRSIEKCGFRYKFVISDGDSKAYATVKDLKPYGEDFQIYKEEYSNHVAKRIGKALRDLASKTKGIGGNKAGSLTGKKIDKFQRYYHSALLQNKGDNDAIRKANQATLEHSSSTNECPNHSFCPSGEGSWCFYNKGVAQGKDLKDLDHNDSKNRTLYIRKDIVKLFEPIYKRFCTDEFLNECTGQTPNANECLHSVISSKASKSIFYGRKRIEFLVASGVMQFNHGKQYSGPTYLGAIGQNLSKKRDKVRMATAAKREATKLERREKYRKKIEKDDLAEEGVT